MQQFIYDKHVEALSDVALSVLAEEEMNKPVSKRSVNCFGSTILTNIGHRGCSEGERGRNEQDGVPWTSLKIDQIRSAYMLFVHPTDNNRNIKKAAMIEELLVAFMQRPQDLDIFDDDGDDDENES